METLGLRVWIAFVLLSWLPASGLSASFPSDDRLEQGDCAVGAGQARLLARRLLEEAVHTKKPRVARFYIETAYQLSPAPQLLYNLGLLALREGEILAARDLLLRYAAEVGKSIPDEHKRVISQAEQNPAAPHRVLDVKTAPGSFVFVDDHLTGQAPLKTPLLLAERAHELRVVDGYRHLETRVSEAFSDRERVISKKLLLPQTLLVLSPELSSEQQILLQSLLTDEGFALVSAEDRDLLLRKLDNRTGCLTQARCQVWLGEQLAAQRILVVRSLDLHSVPSAQRTRLSFEALAVPHGAVLFSAQTLCTNCSSVRSETYLRALARALKRELPELTGSPSIKEEPPPAGFSDGYGHDTSPCALRFGTARQLARKLLSETPSPVDDHDLLVRLETAQALSPSPLLLYNLGLLAHREGDAVAAVDLLGRFLAQAGSERTAERAAKAESLTKPLPVPFGQVTVTGLASAQVFVGGRLRGALPLVSPLLLSPGPHTLLVQHGYRSVQKEILVRPQETLAVQVDLPEATLLLSDDQWVAENPALFSVMKHAAEALGQTVVSERDYDLLSQRSIEYAACGESLLCMRRVGKMLGTQSVISVGRTNGVWLGRLLAVRDGAWTSSSSAKCTTCPGDDLAIRFVVQELLGKATKPRGEPILSAQPEAKLFLDGWELGNAPQRQRLIAGRYQIDAVFSPTDRVSMLLRVPQDKSLTLRLPTLPHRNPKLQTMIGASFFVTSAVFLGVGLGLFGHAVSNGNPTERESRSAAEWIASPIFVLGSAATATAGGLWFGLRKH